MSNAATDLLPPPHCLTRSEGTHTVISARVSTGMVGWFITAFAAFWTLITTASLVANLFGGLIERVRFTPSSTTAEQSPAMFFVLMIPFVLIALGMVAAALYLRRGRVEAKIGHDDIELFTGVMGIGRREHVARNVVRGVSIVSSNMQSSSGRTIQVIRLDGSDVTTGLFLGPAGKAWFAQELRRALNLPPAPPA
ncbi:MAG TPA: hypothetical protein VK157_16050 [Phycisphaerales bacterium]|nr:hypothetical protein [Phycisphaerales bacterium]